MQDSGDDLVDGDEVLRNRSSRGDNGKTCCYISRPLPVSGVLVSKDKVDVCMVSSLVPMKYEVLRSRVWE